MLGRYAAEVREVLGGKEITSMEQAKQAGKQMKERLWEIMVRVALLRCPFTADADNLFRM